MKEEIPRIIPSRPKRIMLERYDQQGNVMARRYGPEQAAERLEADGWTVYVPARGGGWKLRGKG
jgi:hypothetical protein